mmetsp:Transcript_11017/g.25634  ORF Transcript_11017/g.25634 Transcript_11017/m.25634 type:complete len:555 (-) Transcript_11017:31-1695(-)
MNFKTGRLLVRSCLLSGLSSSASAAFVVVGSPPYWKPGCLSFLHSWQVRRSHLPFAGQHPSPLVTTRTLAAPAGATASSGSEQGSVSINKKKKKRDPAAPKKPKNAYLFFCAETRPEIKASNPDATFGELQTLLGKAYRELTPEDKAPFDKLAEADKLRYGQELERYSPMASDDEDAKPRAKAEPKKRRGKGSTPASKKQKGEEQKPKSPKKKKVDHQRWTERTPLTRHWNAAAAEGEGSYTFTVVSWNVAGLRAFVKKQPDALKTLAEQYGADVICLQEHKLQDIHLDDPKLKLRDHFKEKIGDFEGSWSYSTKKKGYSGTAMFIRKWGKKGKKQSTMDSFMGQKADDDKSKIPPEVPTELLEPIKVETEFGSKAHDGEGRICIAEFPLFYLVNTYVPNSGQKLDRLKYRTEEWDTDFLHKMRSLEDDGKPVIWLGDLNVAFNEKDTWNEGAKHLPKSAGTTPEERASFDRQLGAGFVDAFRHLHPEGRGHYSYWSQRAGNRGPNKGLRLDYFICSQELFEDGSKVRVRDSYMLPDMEGSDHCPIVLEIEIKK